jgi:mannose-6-phosphate isomerase-like protein (cupin superfamily)
MTQQVQTQQLEKADPYYDWQAREGIRAITGLYIEDLNTVPLDPWARTGGRGAFINLGTKRGYKRAAYLSEIPGAGSLDPQRHCFEEVVYVVSGRGATTVWQEGQEKQLIEWSAGSLLSIPLNAWFQHFNGGDQPARLLAYNNAPEVMSLFHNERFLFDNPFVFDDRFAGEAGYFSNEGTLYSVRNRSYKVLETNFVADAPGIQLYEWAERGAGGLNVMFEMAGGVVPTHISQFPVGTYKKAHRHGEDVGGGALLLILGGTGFSLVWPPGERDFQKLAWGKNSLFVAPSSWFHQHFNTGPTPARYLALRGGGSQKYETGGGGWIVDKSVKEGGSQIEYDDEDPRIHQTFEEELMEHGATCRMSQLSPHCTAK